MVESRSPAPDFITSPELEKGIKDGSITTFTITKEFLPYYQMAARATKFEVTVIAEPGQHYPTEYTKPVGRRSNTNAQENNTSTITVVKSQDPVKKGYVGISLKRPEGVTNDTAFNTERQKKQPI